MLRVVSLVLLAAQRLRIELGTQSTLRTRIRLSRVFGKTGGTANRAIGSRSLFPARGLSYNKSSGAAGSRHPTRGLKHCRLDC